MKRLYNAILGGLMSLPLLFGGCIEYKGNVELQGTVVNEKYIPEVGGWGGSSSKYILTVETEQGKTKAVEIYGGGKESLDTLIEKGSKITITIPIEKINKSIIYVRSDRVTKN